jgi:DNA-directed RNA polymerase subunit RPC12/RpoP
MKASGGWKDGVNAMTRSAQQHMPLTSAYLCQDCESVGNSSMRCPACSSTILMCLATVLDRQTGVQAAKVLQFPALAA